MLNLTTGLFKTETNIRIIFCYFRARTWVVACNREDLLGVVNTLNKSHRICQDHFELKMFTNDQCNRLNPNAVPTLFPLQEGSSRGPNFDHTYTPLYDLKSLDKSEKNMPRINILQDIIINPGK